MKTKEALHFGGGNIGRALIGPIMRGSDFELTFVDVNQGLVDSFNTEKGYPITVVSSNGMSEQYIDNVAAVSVFDREALCRKIVSADMITTAVGVAALPHIAPLMADGLIARVHKRPKDELHVAIIACENTEGNSSILKEHVLACIDNDATRKIVNDMVSFPDCAVDRIVPIAASSSHPLSVTTEDYFQLVIDQNGLLADIPHLEGVQIAEDLSAVLAQKFFTLNGAHAAVAYYGYKKGVETIHEAMQDDDIYNLCAGFMNEVSLALLRRHSSLATDAQYSFVQKTMQRFMNPYLKDQATRVGRDPLRKLGRSDRLIAPMLMAQEYGLGSYFVATAVVGAMQFDYCHDPESVRLKRDIQKRGIVPVVAGILGVDTEHPLTSHIASLYHFSSL